MLVSMVSPSTTPVTFTSLQSGQVNEVPGDPTVGVTIGLGCGVGIGVGDGGNGTCVGVGIRDGVATAVCTRVGCGMTEDETVGVVDAGWNTVRSETSVSSVTGASALTVARSDANSSACAVP